MKNKTNFLLASITDIQGTIRAIDVKIGITIVILLSPLSQLGRIGWHLENIFTKTDCYFFWTIIVAFILFWILSFITFLRALSGINNPKEHILINEDDHVKGTFYSGGNFHLSGWIIFSRQKQIKSTRNIKYYLENLPDSDEQEISELLFDQLKLCYIRDIKMKLYNWGIVLLLVFMLLGFILYFKSRFLL